MKYPLIGLMLIVSAQCLGMENASEGKKEKTKLVANKKRQQRSPQFIKTQKNLWKNDTKQLAPKLAQLTALKEIAKTTDPIVDQVFNEITSHLSIQSDIGPEQAKSARKEQLDLWKQKKDELNCLKEMYGMLAQRVLTLALQYHCLDKTGELWSLDTYSTGGSTWQQLNPEEKGKEVNSMLIALSIKHKMH